MSEVIAGLVGGLLALAGGFGVQALRGHQEAKTRMRTLAATFLADTEMLRIRATEMRVVFKAGQRNLPTNLSDPIGSLEAAMRTGHELALLAKTGLATTVREMLAANEELILQTAVATEDGWNTYVDNHKVRWDKLEAAFDTEYGLKYA